MYEGAILGLILFAIVTGVISAGIAFFYQYLVMFIFGIDGTWIVGFISSYLYIVYKKFTE
jgi:hypothetical protein